MTPKEAKIMPNREERAIWPGWKVVRLIGRGSYGAVYEIERDTLGEKEKAAMKQISIPQSKSAIDELRSEGYDEPSIRRLYRGYLKSIVDEYLLMRRMNGSSNVVDCDDVYYVEHENGIGWDVYIKMELLTPLLETLKPETDEERVKRLGMDICRALVLCGKHRIIHRDIKPANIFVSENGDYKLGDFGIAKMVEKTSGGTKIGTYEYMAPEVYWEQPYGCTADIYSLGMVLYWLLNERRTPFLALPPQMPTDKDKENARKRRFRGDPLPYPVHGGPELQRIVLKACAYDARDRYQSAEEMLRDLERLPREDWGGEKAAPAAVPAPKGYPFGDRGAGEREPDTGEDKLSSGGAPFFDEGRTVSDTPLFRDMRPAAGIGRESEPAAEDLGGTMGGQLGLRAAKAPRDAFREEGTPGMDTIRATKRPEPEPDETEPPEPTAAPDSGWEDPPIAAPGPEKAAGKSRGKGGKRGLLIAAAAAVLLIVLALVFWPRGGKTEPAAKNEEPAAAEAAPASDPKPEKAPEEPQPSPIDYAAQFRDAAVGDTVLFGAYEQDNDSADGKEHIEWIVLEKEEDRLLVVSKYALDCRPYHDTNTDVSWESCSLRSWLNESFLAEAFDETEQARIPRVTVSADKNPGFDADPGSDAKDRVYLLSIQEVNRYLDTEEARNCAATAYAVSRGAGTGEAGGASCWWWLRSPGNFSRFAAIVLSGGAVHDYGIDVNGEGIAVRPVLWINLGSNEQVEGYARAEALLASGDYGRALAAFTALGDYSNSAEKVKECKTALFQAELQAELRATPVGSVVKFGRYEQDDNEENGKEEIEWIVLAKEDGRMLVISRYALDCKPYNETPTEVTWETCTLRTWLNESFLAEAFNEDELPLIPTVTVTAHASGNGNPGRDTRDRVFLLSLPEADALFDSDQARSCALTDYAIAQGAWTSGSERVDGRAACQWWLRSTDSEPDRARCIVAGGGSSWDYVDYSGNAVRPAIWILVGQDAAEGPVEEPVATSAPTPAPSTETGYEP
jgi:hypothetical protein